VAPEGGGPVAGSPRRWAESDPPTGQRRPLMPGRVVFTEVLLRRGAYEGRQSGWLSRPLVSPTCPEVSECSRM
jgi:hypothetical protein